MYKHILNYILNLKECGHLYALVDRGILYILILGENVRSNCIIFINISSLPLFYLLSKTHDHKLWSFLRIKIVALQRLKYMFEKVLMCVCFHDALTI